MDAPTVAPTLQAALREEHDRLRSAFEAVQAAPRDGDPRSSVRALDEAIAALCCHLGAVEQEVLPLARRTLPDGGPTIRAAEADLRALHRLMRRAEQCVWGDARSAEGTAEEFGRQLREALDLRTAWEERLAGQLDEVLDEHHRARAVERLPLALRRSPTRPHPRRVHLGRLDGLVSRALATVDDAMDAMDVRLVRAHQPQRQTPVLSRWGAWAMGTGLPAQAAQDTGRR